MKLALVERGQVSTPPKWVQHRREEEAPMVLEHRLMHFLDWLADKGVVLWKPGNDFDLGFSPDAHVLVDEYVNS